VTSVNPLSPEIIEFAYRKGFFPMPHPDSGEVLWFDPDPRTIIPLDGFRVSQSLKRSIRNRGYLITFNKAFELVVRSCADRDETWINEDFVTMYLQMHAIGRAHSVEVWSEQQLVGGVFGLSFNGVFNGESMFSKKTDASKIALYFLIEEMKKQGLALFEVQFMTSHLASLGAIGIPKEAYHKRLEEVLNLPVIFKTPQ
jgi:leucyl/phenylalanyl-tRNA---protein transferase